jgi:hypothetical protein
MPWFEDLPLDFTKSETREAERLLIVAFPNTYTALTFAEDAGLQVAALNQNLPPKFLMRDMLGKARLSDRLVQLIAQVLSDPGLEAVHPGFRTLIKGHEGTFAAAALRRKPSLATLAALPPTVEVWRPGNATAESLATPGLEKIVNAAAGFADPALFRFRLAEAEVRTARIDVGGHPQGSGFLVADNLLLTNWHVVAPGVEGAVAVFDHKISAAGVQDAGRAVKFAENWLIAKSVHSKISQELGTDGPAAGNWDFALIRLAEPVAAQAIGPDPNEPKADRRGRYLLDGNVYLFNEAEPIFILGHPAGRPVQFSYASPSGASPTKNSNRVRYRTNTEGGSSGSPVFNRDWRVVALHHAAGPTQLPGDFNLKTNDFNQGVPIKGIVEELKLQLADKPELTALGLA